MPQALGAAGHGGLIERDVELRAIDRALEAATAGEGALQLFEGPAGIGKTALLDRVRVRADRAGVTVVKARGGELEGDFPYGIVRQLFEPVVRAATGPGRERLLAGAAALAAPAVLGPEAQAGARGDPTFAVVHGLYWLVANLAAESPVALVVDDVHWSDAPSLRFLIYLARRLDGLPATLIASIRTGETAAEPGLVDDFRSSPGAWVAVPAALGETAVGRLLTADFGIAPEPGFARACREVTRGNPFLVGELAAALVADGIEPSADAVELVASIGPITIARATLGRLGHLSQDAVDIARAVAVLGGDATLPRAARLAGLDERQALAALDALTVANIVPASGRLEFNHPVVRTAIYHELAPGQRSATHHAIAELLAVEGAEVDSIASHLLVSEPMGSPETVATLRDAASRALALGAPDSAATYLQRALAEGCERELRPTVLLELALAEKLARRPDATEHLEQVRRIAEDPTIRARAAIEQAGMLVYSGDWQRPLALLDGALAELGDRDPALALRSDTILLGMSGYDPRLVERYEQRMSTVHELAISGGAPARSLALMLAGIGSFRGEPFELICSLVERGWDGGRLCDQGTGDESLPQGLGALIVVDELARATELVESLADLARRRGSIAQFLIAIINRVWIATRGGSLLAAGAELRSGCDLALEVGAVFAIPTLLFYGAEALLERPDLVDLAALAETIELGPMAEVCSGALLFQTRGRLRFAAGDTAAAIADLRRAGTIFRALSFVNPNAIAWRSTLALMLAPSDRDEALELASSELADAERIGQPRGIGVALRALGTLVGGGDGLSHLEAAVGVLADSPARLEHARALIEFGAALRRDGHRAAARTPLRDGLDLATHGGASRLAERAQTELAASGAKPRRPYTTSRDALTPSELRVARLAAEGRSNPEIAQGLFVTTKTIDAHLQHSYAKLGINSRKQLAEALARESR